MEFYGSNEKHGPVSQPIESPNFFVTFEMTAHQFLRVRGYSTTQIRVMRFIHNHGSANLKNLQDALSIKSAAMSELVTKLEDKGLVYRTTSQKDRRVKELRLTEMGEEAMRQQEKREEQMDLFSALTDEEKSTLDTLLRKLGNDWKQRES
jgi:DNA-binding MarR family transcriptional regulator